MSRIRSADTKPEMLIRRGLHARGFRFRLHDRKLHHVAVTGGIEEGLERRRVVAALTGDLPVDSQ